MKSFLVAFAITPCLATAVEVIGSGEVATVGNDMKKDAPRGLMSYSPVAVGSVTAAVGLGGAWSMAMVGLHAWNTFMFLVTLPFNVLWGLWWIVKQHYYFLSSVVGYTWSGVSLLFMIPLKPLVWGWNWAFPSKELQASTDDSDFFGDDNDDNYLGNEEYLEDNQVYEDEKTFYPEGDRKLLEFADREENDENVGGYYPDDAEEYYTDEEDREEVDEDDAVYVGGSDGKNVFLDENLVGGYSLTTPPSYDDNNDDYYYDYDN